MSGWAPDVEPGDVGVAGVALGVVAGELGGGVAVAGGVGEAEEPVHPARTSSVIVHAATRIPGRGRRAARGGSRRRSIGRDGSRVISETGRDDDRDGMETAGRRPPAADRARAAARARWGTALGERAGRVDAAPVVGVAGSGRGGVRPRRRRRGPALQGRGAASGADLDRRDPRHHGERRGGDLAGRHRPARRRDLLRRVRADGPHRPGVRPADDRPVRRARSGGAPGRRGRQPGGAQRLRPGRGDAPRRQRPGLVVEHGHRDLPARATPGRRHDARDPAGPDGVQRGDPGQRRRPRADHVQPHPARGPVRRPLRQRRPRPATAILDRVVRPGGRRGAGRARARTGTSSAPTPR